VQAELDKL
jgi:hypothetical protein